MGTAAAAYSNHRLSGLVEGNDDDDDDEDKLRTLGMLSHTRSLIERPPAHAHMRA